MKQFSSLVAVLLFAGCLGSDMEKTQQQAEPHLVDPAVAATYSEASEAANGDFFAGAEDTSYSLDDQGLIISAVFEAGAPTLDTFRFNTGSYGRIHVQTYVNGIKQTEANKVVSLRMDSSVEDGYSALLGSGYFIDAILPSNGDFHLGVYPGPEAAGLSYTVELVGAP